VESCILKAERDGGKAIVAQVVAVTDAIPSLAEAQGMLGLTESSDPNFFREWIDGLPELQSHDRERLDQIKGRYLYHRQYGHLLENAVNFLVISPLLELAGLYDAPFRLRSEVGVRLDLDDEDGTVYQGRIDALIVQGDSQANLWVVLVEAKRTSFNMTLALPQALAYMAMGSRSAGQSGPRFGLVSNGEYSMFVKLDGTKYGFSDDFSLNRRRNELWDVLRILNRLKGGSFT
jgi:hypothetical protein